MATTEEDFSFPTGSPPRSLDSPPLWRRSSKGKEVEEAERPPLQELKSTSAKQEKCTSPSSSSTLDDQKGEEKMDMLWEDLNEDHLVRNSGNSSDICSSSPRRGVQISCVKALKLSKGNGSIVSGKKTSVLVFIKVLKKVFLMHSSQRAIKKKPSW